MQVVRLYFVGKGIIMVFNLALRSITCWKQFENAFITQFGDDKTSGTLFLDISRIMINQKEKVKDFNQRFTTLLNRIPNKPTEVVQIEFYTATNCHVCEEERNTNFGREFGGIHQS